MRATIGLATLLMTVACQAPAPPEMTAADEEAIRAQIMDVSNSMIEAWNAFDLDASMSFFHPEETSFAWGSTVYDYQALTEHWAEVWSQASGQEATWTHREIRVLSPEAALFQGSFELRFFYNDGRVALWPGAHWTALFEPYEGEWKITYAGYSYGGSQLVESRP